MLIFISYFYSSLTHFLRITLQTPLIFYITFSEKERNKRQNKRSAFKYFPGPKDPNSRRRPRVLYCTVVRGLSGAPLYLTRKGSRVDVESMRTKNRSKKSSNPRKILPRGPDPENKIRIKY